MMKYKLALSVFVSCSMLEWLSEVFWQERLWFPEGLGWADLEDRDGRVYAKARDLWVAVPIAIMFLVIRQVFERWVNEVLFSFVHIFISTQEKMVVIVDLLCFLLACRFVATPLASMLGVKETVRRRVTYNQTLESHYCNTSKNPTQVHQMLTTLYKNHTNQHHHMNCCWLFFAVFRVQ